MNLGGTPRHRSWGSRVLPIWGSFVEQATGLDTIGYWPKFQHVLTCEHRLISDWLGELRSHATNMA
jgi:hypothetical protein